MSSKSVARPDREPSTTSTSDAKTNGASSTIHEVSEVYVYIPPELSAAGVELKIAGSVRVINKVKLDVVAAES